MCSLNCRLHALARYFETAAQEESAREIKAKNPCEVTSYGGQPQEQGQSAHQRENQQVMNEYPLLHENVYLPHDQ